MRVRRSLRPAWRRTTRRFAALLVLVLAVSLTGLPHLAPSQGGFPMSWLWSGLSLPAGWASPMPPTPRQVSGSAGGRGHSASAKATRAGSGSGTAPGKVKGQVPLYKPAARKFTVGSSAPGLRGYDAKSSQRVATKSTATSTYYANADGSHTVRYAQAPVNYRDSSGAWQPIDTRMQASVDGRWHETANSLTLDTAPLADDTRLASVGFGGTRLVSYGLRGAAPVRATVSGSSVTYPGVLPATDLRLTSTATGLREATVLRSAQAPTTWVFTLDLRGLTAALTANDSIELRDATGKSVGVIPAGYAYDSRVDPHSGERATTHAVSYQLQQSADGVGTDLQVTLDPAWLRDPARAFPVTLEAATVDSSLAIEGIVTTYTASNTPPADHSLEDIIKIGSFDSGVHSAVSYLQFPGLGIDNSHITVTEADLDLTVIHANGCPTAERFDVAPVTQAWTPSGLRSWPGPPLGASIGSDTEPTPKACANTAIDPAVGDGVSVSLSVATFNAWAAGTTPDYGLGIYAPTTDSLHWKYLASGSNVGVSASILILTYSGLRLPEITSQDPPNGANSATLTPVLSAHGEMDDNLVSSNPVRGGPQFEYQVFTSGGAPVADSGIVNGPYQVPAGKLRWGQTYLWEVQAFDGAAFSLNPVWYQLTTQPPQPAVTSTLSQNEGHGFDPTIGNYTTSATDAEVSTVGPALSVSRDYNSRDPRTTGAFGAGWSSIYDAAAAERYDPSGAVLTVVATYPDGSQVAYARNADGTFTAPQGRAAKLIHLSNGYELIDKSVVRYAFTQSLGSGAYGLSSVTDANSRAETFTWSGGHIATATSVVSGRSLHLTWTTPGGASSAHVTSVATDPATIGQPETARTWTYMYFGDQLAAACPPGTISRCSSYGYTTGSPYYTQVLDQSPQSYWPLAESSGTSATSEVLASEGTDTGTYTNVTLASTASPLTGSTTMAPSFNGTSSYVALPDTQTETALATSLSLWFKMPAGSPAGAIFSTGTTPVTSPFDEFSTVVDATLYVGTDGKLYGGFWLNAPGAPPLLKTAGSVADNNWHHVVLTGSAVSRSMYLDGALVGSGTGWQSQPDIGDAFLGEFKYAYLGAGFLGDVMPDNPWSGTGTLHQAYFKGSISNVSLYQRALTPVDVTALNQAGRRSSSLVNVVNRQSGKTYASVSYDPLRGTVQQMTDENGGTWHVNPPTVAGSSQVYRGSVLGANPVAYYRLGENAGAAVAPSEVKYPSANYVSDTLGGPGPFADNPSTAFNGSTSYVQLPTNTIKGTTQSVSMWFSTTHTGGVLLSYQAAALSAGSTSENYTPALYVGSDGKMEAGFWPIPQIATAKPVNDGAWHHVVLSAAATTQSLYLDGTLVGTTTGTILSPQDFGQANDYIGTGYIGGGWPDQPHQGQNAATPLYFNGSIGEVAFYRSALSGDQAAAQWAAAQRSVGLTPVETVSETDPGGKTLSMKYDLQNSHRLISSTDGLGNTTSYGYDTSGFLATVTDPNGDVTTTGHDEEGNEVTKTTCQNQATTACSTTYQTFHANTMGADQAKGATATASSSHSGWSPAAAVDGNTTVVTGAPGWSSLGSTTANTTQWIQLDLGSARTLDQVDLYPRTDVIGAGFPQAFTVAVSANGSAWTTVSTQTNYPKPTTPAPAAFGFTATSVRYVKVTGTTLRTDGSSTFFMQFAELTAVNDLPDPLAGVVLTQRDPRSSSPTDNAYLTTYAYDAVGDVTSVTGPPVPGFPSGRTTTFAYTDGGTVTAADTGWAPAGLPYRTTSPSGAVQSVGYFHNGDVASTTDADGLVTTYTYDNLGEVLTKTVSPGGPQGWWRLNQTSGTVVSDSSGVGNGATTTNVTWSGGAAVFNGSSSWMAARTPVINTGTSFTMSAWVNLAAIPTTVEAVLATPGGSIPSAELSYSTGLGTWKFQTSGADTSTSTNSVLKAPSAPTVGVWTHLVGVYDAVAGTQSFYVNGSLAGSNKPPTTWASQKPLAIGYNGSGAFFGGSIANVQVYQRALSASEVATLNAAGFNGATVATTTPSGLTTSYGYDTEGQVTSEVDPTVLDRVTGAQHTPHLTTSYDDDGDVMWQTVTDDTGGDARRTRSMTYNDHDQMVTATDARGNVTTYAYDGYGNKTSETDARGTTTNSTFDPNGHLLTQVIANFTGDPAAPHAPTAVTEESRAYDPAGRLASLTDAMGNTTSYTYTDNGLPVTATRTDSSGHNPFVMRSDVYDAAGNIVQETTNNGATTTAVTLDAASRPVTTREDPTGLNRTTTLSYTPDDRVATSTRTDGSGATLATSATYDPMGRVTSQSVASDGAGHPLGWWRLNQSTGPTVADSSGLSNTATANSGVTWNGSAATFDGAGGVIATNGPVLTTTASYSVSAWVNLANTSTFYTAVSQGGTAMGAFYLQYSPSNGSWAFVLPNRDDGTAPQSAARTFVPPATNTWTHLVGVFDAGTNAISLYVNGALAASGTAVSPWQASGPLTIGGMKLANGHANDFFNGQVANVQAYQRALSAAEVSTLFGAGRDSGTVASSTQLTTSRRLDQRGLPLSETDANGNTTNYSYDEAGHLAQVTGPPVAAENSGGTGVFSRPVAVRGYNNFGELVEEQDPVGNVTTTVYDENGRAVSQTMPGYTPPGSTTPITATTVRTYDEVGNLTKVSDPLSHDTSYVYDQLGDLATVTDPDGGVTHSTYDLDGDRLSVTDPTGAQAQATYDDMGRQVTTSELERFPSSAVYTTRYSYAASTADPGGAWLSSQTSPNGVVTSYAYSKLGEKTSVTDGANNTTSFRYDFLGRPSATVMPDGTSTTASYDALGDQTSSASLDASGVVLALRTAGYDDVGNLLSASDARGTTTHFGYDAGNRLTREVQPTTATDSITTSFGYDAAGNRTRFTDGRNNSWIYTYNSWNLPESEIEPATPTAQSPPPTTPTAARSASHCPAPYPSPRPTTQRGVSPTRPAPAPRPRQRAAPSATTWQAG
jgi:large repetitive protein